MSAVGFQTILEGLLEAGLISRQQRQRLDSTQILGQVSSAVGDPARLRVTSPVTAGSMVTVLSRNPPTTRTAGGGSGVADPY